MVDRIAAPAVLIGELRPQTIHVAVITLEREVPKQVIKRTIFQHQHDNVVDLLQIRHTRVLRQAHRLAFPSHHAATSAEVNDRPSLRCSRAAMPASCWCPCRSAVLVASLGDSIIPIPPARPACAVLPQCAVLGRVPSLAFQRGPGWCYSASLSSAISESATAIAKPKALRMFPPAETTRAVPTTGATPIRTAWMSSAVTAFLGGARVGEIGGWRCVHRDLTRPVPNYRFAQEG